MSLSYSLENTRLSASCFLTLINLRRASTGFAVALVTSSEVDAKKAFNSSGSTVSGGVLGVSGYH